MAIDTSPFESLAALKAEHGRLLRAGSNNPESAQEQSDLTSSIVNFLAKVRATGACLDTPTDREAAQSILDYWTAKLFTLPHGVSAASSLPALIPGTAAGAVNLQLAEFDTKKVMQAAQAAENAFSALPTPDQSLAQRILMRLVRLPPGSPTFVANKVTREELLALGSNEQVTRVVNALTAANIITERDGQIQLQYEALGRVWPRFSDWLKKRKSFREAVQYWVQHKGESGDKAALLSGELLREVEKYHDLTGDEEAFKDASRGQEVDRAKSDRRWKWVFASLAAIALAGWAIAGSQARRANEQAKIAKGQSIVALQEKTNAEAATALALKAGEELKQANAGLNKKQELSALAPMARAVTEIGLRAGPDTQGRQIARERLRQMIDAYKNNADLDAIMGQVPGLKTIADGKETTVDERRKVQYSLLVQGRKLREAALAGASTQVREMLKAERAAAFGMVDYCTSEIVDVYAKLAYSAADPFVTEFWLLYWGDLAFVEGPAVETAMVRFGSKLREIDDKIQAQAPAGLRKLTSTLKEKALTPRQQNQFMQQSIDDPKNRTEASSLPKKVAAEDVAQLRTLLGELKAALAKERGADLNFKPPVAGY